MAGALQRELKPRVARAVLGGRAAAANQATSTDGAEAPSSSADGAAAPPETPAWAVQLMTDAEARWADFEQSRRRQAAVPVSAAQSISAAADATSAALPAASASEDVEQATAAPSESV